MLIVLPAVAIPGLLLSDAMLTEISCGAVESTDVPVEITTALPSVVSPPATPPFPAKSTKLATCPAAPLTSVSTTVRVAEKLSPEPVTVSANCPAIVTTGSAESASVTVSSSVIVSPTDADDTPAALSDLIVTDVTDDPDDGAVVSIVTALLSVVVDAGVPLLPNRSTNATLTLTRPSESVAATDRDALYAVPLPVTVAATSPIVTVGGWTSSEKTSVSVIVSPPVATSADSLLLEVSCARLIVGGTTSDIDCVATAYNELPVLCAPVLALVKARSPTDTLMVRPLFPVHVSVYMVLLVALKTLLKQLDVKMSDMTKSVLTSLKQM